MTSPQPKVFWEAGRGCFRDQSIWHSCCRNLLPSPLTFLATVFHSQNSLRDPSGIHRTAWETQNSLRQPSVVPHENTSVCVKVSSPGPRLNAKVGRVVPSLTLYLIHLQGSKAGPQVLNVIHIPSWKQFLQCLPQIFLQRFKNNPGGWICKYTKSNTLALGPPPWANKYLEESPAHKFFKEPDSRLQSRLD